MRPRLDTRELGLVLSACAALSALVVVNGSAGGAVQDVALRASAFHAPWLAWLGLTLAGCGTYALARVLGLVRVGASLAAVGYACSGFGLSRLEGGAPMVIAVLPWLLLSIEGVHRTSGSTRRWAVVLTALMSAWNVLGGDPHTSSCNALCAACWSLAPWGRDRRAAIWSATGLGLGVASAWLMLAAFGDAARLLSDLRHLIAWIAHEARTVEHLDYLSLAGWAFLLMALSWWRESRTESHALSMQRSATRSLPQAVIIVACVLGIAFCLGRRGESLAGALAVCPDLFGTPASGGYRDAASYLESLGAWLPLALVTGSWVSFLSRRGPLARRAEIQVLAGVFTLVAVSAPGVVDLWRDLPLVGVIAPAGAAGVAALMLAVLAGEVFDLEDRTTRCVTAAICLGLAAICVLPHVQHADLAQIERVHGAPDPADEIVGWIERPSQALPSGRTKLVGWVHPALPVERAVVRRELLDDRGAPVADEAVEIAATWDDEGPLSAHAGPVGARVFRIPELDLSAMRGGVWRLRVIFYGRGAQSGDRPLGSRTAALFSLVPEPRLSLSTACMLLAMSILLCVPRWNGATAWGVVILAAGQALHLARSLNPTM